MGIKRGRGLLTAIEQVLISANRTSVSELGRKLRVDPRRCSELIAELQDRGLVRVRTVRTGKRGRPIKQVLLTAAGIRMLELLRGENLDLVEIRRESLERLVGRALDRCRQCHSKRILDRTCMTVSSFAHFLGMDHDGEKFVCSCLRR
jgi:predicted ArsR family transcriptional regulator